MRSTLGILLLILMALSPSPSSAEQYDFESKFWIWHDALQIQLTDRKAGASMIVYMEYDAHGKDFLTHFEQHFIAKKGRTVPMSLLKFKEFENLKGILNFVFHDKYAKNILNSTIKPKQKKSTKPSYVFLPREQDDQPFYGDPKTEEHYFLKFQLNRIMYQILYDERSELAYSRVGVCSQYLLP